MSYLQQLNTAFNKLAKAKNMDDLLRRAVSTVQQILGFDRAGIMLYDAVTNEQVGTWGTDANGKIRDEHDFRGPLADNLIRLHSHTPIKVSHEADLFDFGEVIATGWHVQAAIFSGNDLLGWLFIDNLLKKKPLDDDGFEAIKTFSNVLGQLMVRSKIEDTLLDALDSLASTEGATNLALERVTQLEDQIEGNQKLVVLAERLSGLVPMSSRSVGNLVNFISLLSPAKFTGPDQALLDSARKSADQLSRIYKHFDEKVHEATDNDLQVMPAAVVQDYWLSQFTSLFRQTPHDLEITSHDPEEELSIPLILLTQLVRELIQNSLQHGLEHCEDGITRVSLARTERLLTITVEDSGQGLDEDQYLEVQKLFVTSKPYELLGTGLNVTQHYVERWLNGQLDLGPSDIGGLKCTLNIPIAPKPDSAGNL